MKRALIIDDEEEICLLLKHQLAKLGVISDVAYTLGRGLAAYKPKEHDVVFLDINLPDGNGLEAVPLLKGVFRDVKIIICSAYNSSTERDKALEYGVFEFLAKPFSKENVLEILGWGQKNNFF